MLLGNIQRELVVQSDNLTVRMHVPDGEIGVILRLGVVTGRTRPLIEEQPYTCFIGHIGQPVQHRPAVFRPDTVKSLVGLVGTVPHQSKDDFVFVDLNSILSLEPAVNSGNKSAAPSESRMLVYLDDLSAGLDSRKRRSLAGGASAGHHYIGFKSLPDFFRPDIGKLFYGGFIHIIRHYFTPKIAAISLCQDYSLFT